MNVLLVNPWYVSRSDATRSYPSEPTGLMCLATYARGLADIKILDCWLEGSETAYATDAGWRSGLTDEQFADVLRGYRPELVGIHCNYTFGAATALQVARAVKRWRPEVPTLIGGAHATLDAEHLIHHPDIDLVAVGEGERTFNALLQADAKRADIPGLCWKEGSTVTLNRPARPLSGNEIPTPDRTTLDRYSDYLRPLYFHTLQHPVATTSTSRGCPFRCMFCSTHVSWGNTWRGRSPQSMIQECLELRDKWGVREVAFQDDQFLGDPERILQFCALAAKMKPRMTFTVPPGNSPMKMTPQLLDAMAAAGFYRLCFSVDVGTQRVATFIKKPVKLSKIRPLVKHANKRGIWTYGTIVIGHPTETEADVRASIRYAWSLGLDFLRFYVAQPHLGSELFNYWEKRGKINRAEVMKDHSILDAMFPTDTLTAEQLVSLRNLGECGYRRHYLLRLPFRLLEVLPKVWGWRRLGYAIRLLGRWSHIILRHERHPE